MGRIQHIWCDEWVCSVLRAFSYPARCQRCECQQKLGQERGDGALDVDGCYVPMSDGVGLEPTNRLNQPRHRTALPTWVVIDYSMQHRTRDHRLEKSDHFDGRRFVNPTGPAGQPFSAVPRMLLEPRTPWPAHVDDPTRRPPGRDGAAAVVTFIGPSTFLIQQPP